MSESKNTKEITLFPTITSFLKPTTDYLAEELKEVVKAKVESKKRQKEDDNLLRHINSVNEKINSSGNEQISYEQLGLFSDWADSVSKVDPDNKELSQLWQNLLVNASTDNSSEILISKIKSMSPGQAKALIAFADSSIKTLTEEERYHLKALENNELIQPNNSFLSFVKFALGGCMLLVIYLMLKLVILEEYIGSVITMKQADYMRIVISLLPIGFVFGIFILSIKSLQKSGRWAKKIKKLTWIGKKLAVLSRVN